MMSSARASRPTHRYEPKTVLCAVCSQAQLITHPRFNGETEGEQWDWLERELPKQQWAVRIHPLSGARCAVCPGCLKREKHDESITFPPFSGNKHCPKCRGNNVEAKWCNGLPVTCQLLAKREHVHRTCPTCEFKWVEATADSEKKGWFSWLRYLFFWRKRAT